MEKDSTSPTTSFKEEFLSLDNGLFLKNPSQPVSSNTSDYNLKTVHSSVEEHSTGSKTPYTDVVKSNKKASHVKRPMNPFMIWSVIERRKMLETHPEMHQFVLSKALGMKWKALPQEERLLFVEKAEQLRMLHSQEFPHYKYQPKKKPQKSPSSTPTKAENALSSLKAQLLKSSYPVPIKPRSILHSKTATEISTTSQLLKSSYPVPIKPHPILQSKTATEISTTSVVTQKLADDPIPNISQFENKIFSNEEHSYPKLSDINAEANEPKKVFKKKKKSKSKTNLNIYDTLMNVTITELAIDKSCSGEFLNCTEDSMKPYNNAQAKCPLPLHVDGCLTSGSIAALACYRDDWAETFDYLTDKVLQSSKNICEEINIISKQYDEMVMNTSLDLEVPDINKILGKNWRKPNYGKSFLS